ncbi:hypothetical protein [Halococcus salifodinae]|uniref:hypothetical protein n=1 Tax=Halococcus salifodinae TaxID=36738 RepID=UPI00137613AD|nr:hypothetical protein [Halococcus salifodinae]
MSDRVRFSRTDRVGVTVFDDRRRDVADALLVGGRGVRVLGGNELGVDDRVLL